MRIIQQIVFAGLIFSSVARAGPATTRCALAIREWAKARVVSTLATTEHVNFSTMTFLSIYTPAGSFVNAWSMPKRYLFLGGNLAKAVFYPIAAVPSAGITLVRAIRQQGWRGLYGAPVEFILEDGGHFFVYMMLSLIQKHPTMLFLDASAQNRESYDAFSRAKLGDTSHKRTLFISLDRKDSHDARIRRLLYTQQKLLNPDTEFLQFEGTTWADFKKQLTSFAATHGQFEVGAFSTHGLPGLFALGDGVVTRRDLGDAVRGVFAKGAILKLYSCLTAYDSKTNDLGTRFLTALGKNLLDRGGYVMGVTRVYQDEGLEFTTPESQKQFAKAVEEIKFGKSFETLFEAPIVAGILDAMILRAKNSEPFTVVEIPDQNPN